MTTDTRRPVSDTVSRGKSIYERDIRALVEADHHGEYMAIDVESGCWAIGGDELEALDSLEAEKPDADKVFLMRVGYRALYSFGGAALSVTE